MKRRIDRFSLVIVAGLAFAMGHVTDALAQSATERQRVPAGVPEYSIKAAFVYNFARFTEWPAYAFDNAASPIRLCIIGQDPFDGALETIADKSIRSRRLVISYPLWADEAQFCHILFMTESVRERLPEIVARLSGSPVLTIGDTADMAASGGVIGLETVENRIRFRINLDAAERSGLHLSSRLLDLATVVHRDRLTESVD